MKWNCLADVIPPLNTPVLVAEFTDETSETIYIYGEYEMNTVSGENNQIILAFDNFYFDDAKFVYWSQDYVSPQNKYLEKGND